MGQVVGEHLRQCRIGKRHKRDKVVTLARADVGQLPERGWDDVHGVGVFAQAARSRTGCTQNRLAVLSIAQARVVREREVLRTTVARNRERGARVKTAQAHDQQLSEVARNAIGEDLRGARRSAGEDVSLRVVLVQSGFRAQHRALHKRTVVGIRGKGRAFQPLLSAARLIGTVLLPE